MRVLEETKTLKFVGGAYKIKESLKRIILKPKEMHVEALHNDRVFEKLLDYANKNPNIWYMVLTPNYEYTKSRAGEFHLSEEEYLDVVQKRTKMLSQIVKKIGIHPHLYVPYEKGISYEKQQKIILRAIELMAELEIKITDVSFGWWTWDENTVMICDKLGLKIHAMCPYLHDYDLVKEAGV
jgi:hypothetical protein